MRNTFNYSQFARQTITSAAGEPLLPAQIATSAIRSSTCSLSHTEALKRFNSACASLADSVEPFSRVRVAGVKGFQYKYVGEIGSDKKN